MQRTNAVTKPTDRAALTGLADLTDDALLARFSALCAQGHVLTARMIVLLIEIEERRLDLRAACTSMFDFCVRRLAMSEGAAFRRITAARLVTRFPALLARIERGELHLSTLVLLRPHLTEENLEELVASVTGKTQRQVEELLARHAPKPDVPSAITELAAPSNDVRTSSLFAVGDGDGDTDGSGAPRSPSAASPPLARIEPLSEARFKVQLTAGAELKAKLERACDLMRHRNPRGDLAVVLDAPKAQTGSGSGIDSGRAIRAGVRRAVFARDGEQCTFADETGARCPQHGHLELDHVLARALGGTNEAANLRVRCRAHNRLAAEDVFGKAHVAERIDLRRRTSRAAAGKQPVLSSPPPLAHERSTASIPPRSSAPAEGAACSSPARPSHCEPQVLELAVRGLHGMGFSKSDARRAVDHVAQRRVAEGEPLDVKDVLRGALAALT